MGRLPSVPEEAERAGGVKATFGRPVTFKLPHEDEWEYACRGGKGNKQPFHFGAELNGRQANCDGTERPYGTKAEGPYLERTAAVGSYAKKYPHPWNLCDIHGNVSERCDNRRDRNGPDRAIRGGAWGSCAVNCRSANRAFHPPDARYPTGSDGLRVLGAVVGLEAPPDKTGPAATPERASESARVLELRKERITTLNEVFAASLTLAKKGRGEFGDALDARATLFRAELEIAEKEADRVALYKTALESLKELEQLAAARTAAAQGTELDVLKAKAKRLEIEIALAKYK